MVMEFEELEQLEPSGSSSILFELADMDYELLP